MARAKGVCTYCGGVFEALTLDHFVPLAKGGGGVAENLFPCCKGCNSSKRDKDPADWIVEKFGVDGLFRALAANTKLYAARLP
jgi:5-methylcytosine-specific restriction endonuclease McrA